MQSVRSAIFLTKYRAECKIITYPRASIVAQSLTVIRNFARIPESQESARINAFNYVVPPALTPVTGASMRSAIAKLIKFRESSPIGQKNQKIYCLASTSPFGRVKYIILLVLHAAVGEAAFILIILASSGEI